jgi:hypothetical protein
MEWIKDLSDKFIIWLLRATSGFGKELTSDGRREQQQHRDLRLRNLAALAQRSRQRFGSKKKSS